MKQTALLALAAAAGVSAVPTGRETGLHAREDYTLDISFFCKGDKGDGVFDTPEKALDQWTKLGGSEIIRRWDNESKYYN